MAKKVLCIFLAVLCICSTLTVGASELNEIHIYFNDVELQFDKTPVIDGNTVMCELKPVFDAIGIQYDYNGITETVKSKYRNKYAMEAKMGKNTVDFDDVIVDTEAAFYMDENRIIMPLDTVCYGYNIQIERSNLSHIVLSEKPIPEVEDTNAIIAEKLSSIEGEHTNMFDAEGGFLGNSIHENKDDTATYWEESEVDVEGMPFDKALNIKIVKKPFHILCKADKGDHRQTHKSRQQDNNIFLG